MGIIKYIKYNIYFQFYDDQAELLAQYDKDDKLLAGAIEPEDVIISSNTLKFCTFYSY